MAVAVQVALFLAVPLLGLLVYHRVKPLKWLNPVLFSYLAGIFMANTPGIAVNVEAARWTTEAAIPLAIPLILFSSDFAGWLRSSRSTVVSFSLAVLAAFVAAFAAALMLGHLTDEAWRVSGMLVGVYTGGTPNMLGIGMALGAPEETFILLNASDAVMGGLYLLFLVTVAKPLLGRVFPAFPGLDGADGADGAEAAELLPPTARPSRSWVIGMAAAFALSALILLASAGLTWLLVGAPAVAGVFLGLTTGGILASLSPRVRALTGSYALGQYLVLVFCVAMGARTELSQLLASGSVLLLYTMVVMTGAILLHFAAARLFGIDVDTVLITSTAAVYGPAFVGPVAEAIRNRRVVLSGLTAGLVGYALGNYAGMALAWLLRPA